MYLLFVLIQKVTKKSRLQIFQGTVVTVNKTRHNSPSAQTVTLSGIKLRNFIYSLTFTPILTPEKSAGQIKKGVKSYCRIVITEK